MRSNNMEYERITDDPQFDGKTRDSHEMRYRIAAGLIKHGEGGDIVIDAGCGSAYGRNILDAWVYLGLDKETPLGDDFRFGQTFRRVDLEDGKGEDFDMKFDVFVGLEIIEHLKDPAFFIRVARLARKWVVISTPIVKNSNPFHKHSYKEADVVGMMVDGISEWEHYATLKQGALYGIFIFKRRTI